MTHDALVVLLPALTRFRGAALPQHLGRALAQAEITPAEAGEVAQLVRHFQLPAGAGWPIAALQRSEVGCDEYWLRSDPVWWQADLSTARLMAWGNLGLSGEDADALIAALAPGFLDAGIAIDRTSPEQWFLRLPAQWPKPAFAHPADALGDDTFQHLPQGADARRWRGLLSEAQVILHQHPLNARRAAAGLPPINSVWFWGGGTHPGRVSSTLRVVCSRDSEVTALARAAGVQCIDDAKAEPGVLLDLRHQRDAGDWAAMLTELLAVLQRGEVDVLLLDAADGRQMLLRRRQRWRLWRRAWATWPA